MLKGIYIDRLLKTSMGTEISLLITLNTKLGNFNQAWIAKIADRRFTNC